GDISAETVSKLEHLFEQSVEGNNATIHRPGLRTAIPFSSRLGRLGRCRSPRPLLARICRSTRSARPGLGHPAGHRGPPALRPQPALENLALRLLLPYPRHPQTRGRLWRSITGALAQRPD